MPMDNAEKNRRLIDLAESAEARFWRVEFEKLSLPEQVFRAIWEVEAEVNNGGFHQYFLNKSGTNAPSLPAALRAVGAGKMADIAEQAMRACGDRLRWEDNASRRAHLASLDKEHLKMWDEAFQAYPDQLTPLLFQYVSDHKQQIAGAAANF